MKPTYGTVSRAGVFPLAFSLDHVGPLTRTAQDNAIVLEAMLGRDPADPSSVEHPAPAMTGTLGHDIAGLRIGVLGGVRCGGQPGDPGGLRAGLPGDGGARRPARAAAAVAPGNLRRLRPADPAGGRFRRARTVAAHPPGRLRHARPHPAAARRLPERRGLPPRAAAAHDARARVRQPHGGRRRRDLRLQPRAALRDRRRSRGRPHLRPAGAHALQPDRHAGHLGAHGVLAATACRSGCRWWARRSTRRWSTASRTPTRSPPSGICAAPNWTSLAAARSTAECTRTDDAST